jgi:hypothetical protein
MNNSLRSWAGALVAATAISPLFISPAHADPCLVSGASATWNYADLTTGFSCAVGDKVFDFVSVGNLPSNATFTFTDLGSNQHTLSVGGSFTNTSLSGSWDYKITATAAPFPGLIGAQTGATVGFGGSTPTTSISVTGPSGFLGSNTSLPGGGQNNPPIMFAPVSYLDVTTSWSATGADGNTIATITDKFAQGDPTSTVPGPLPVLGAGVAFGFAKRVRRRIMAAA